MTRDSAIASALALLIGAAALGAQAPASAFPFVTFGDAQLLLTNPAVRSGFSWENAGWAFTSTWDVNWSPLTWISHMLDFSLYGADARGHHRTNLSLHALNSMLLFGALRSATRQTGPAAAVALLLALHPLHVESVTWVSERKGLLSATFGFISLWCYVVHTRSARPRTRRLAILCFALGLLAKPTLLVLPLLFLLLDHWPLGRNKDRGLRALALEKWPYFALSAGSAFVTFAVLSSSPVVPNLEALSLGARVANGLVAGVLYLWKLLLPVDLAVFYQHPNMPGSTPWSALQVAGAAALLGLLALAAWRAPHPAPRVGLAWYGTALLPVIGIVQVGSQAMADRYAYLPAIGVYLAVVWIPTEALANRSVALRGAGLGLFCGVLLMLGLATRQQVEVWGSSERLFRHAAQATDGNFAMHYSLASTLKERGEIEEAIFHYRAAVRIHPGLGEAHFNLANTLLAEGDLDAAIEHYRLAAVAMPGFMGARDALGRALIRRGDLPSSVAYYREEALLRPGALDVQANLAHLLRLSGELRESIRAYEAAARLAPEDGRWPRAIEAVRAELHTEEEGP